MEKARDILHAYFKTKTDKPVSDADNLFVAGVLDSIGVLELVSHLEGSLGIEIDPDDISEANFKSIDLIAALAAAKLQ